MQVLQIIRLGLLIVVLGTLALAQDDSQSPQTATPSPAFGQNAPILSPENPPISGIDQPRLDLRQALRSFVSVGLQASESADTNSANQLGNKSGAESASRILGAFDLQRFWPKSDLFAEYLGGGSFYSGGGEDIRQLQALGVMGVTRWRTGEISLRDTFNYLPEGTFGAGAYGGAPGLGIAEAGFQGSLPGGALPGTHIFGGGQFETIGIVPRVNNATIGEVAQSLTPRSAFTIVGAYSFSHFLEHQDVLFNSQQLTLEGGYSYMLNRRDQVAGVYAFQQIHFPSSDTGKIDVHVINLRWGRTLSGRMSILVGAGPQYVLIYQPTYLGFTVGGTEKRWGWSGQAILRYRFARSALTAGYEKFTSAGSGLYAGSDTQVAHLSMSRRLSRTWEFFGAFGYTHNKRLEFTPFALTGTAGKSSNAGFASVLLRKQIGHSWGAFVGYHFYDAGFDATACSQGFGCGQTSLRHIVGIGVDWHPRPVRIE